MSKRVRVGVVGTSPYTDRMHLSNLRSHPGAEVVAICGRNVERARAVADKYAVPHVFTDWQQLIAQGELDALVVSTPDDLHYPITMAALDAGLHVLCEKPLASDTAQAKAMYDKAEDVGVKHLVFFPTYWLPPQRYLRQLVAEGYLGRCYHCHIRQVMAYGRSGEYGWRFDQRRANGILGDLGSHVITLARGYAGEIARVGAHLGTFVERSGPDGRPFEPANDSALLAVEFANGAQGMLHVSAVCHIGEQGMQQQISLYGEAGTLALDFSWTGFALRGVRQPETDFHTLSIPAELWGEVDTARPIEVFHKQAVGDRLFIDAILEDRPIGPNFYDGYKTQQVIDAALESNRTGCWVAIS